MQISSSAQQLIDINAQSQKTSIAIATAVAAKQLDATRQEGQAIVGLIDNAAHVQAPSRGIDVKA